MSRMGADGYSSAGQTQISLKVDESLKERYKQVCEDLGKTMTQDFSEHMQSVVNEYHGVSQSDDGYYPDDEQLQDLYIACLNAADPDLKIYQRRHASVIAQETRQVQAPNLADALIPLRQSGYVARGFMPVDMVGEAYDRWLHWHVKPACADPEHWVKREGQHA